MRGFNEMIYMHKEEGKWWEQIDKYWGSALDQPLLGNVEF